LRSERFRAFSSPLDYRDDKRREFFSSRPNRLEGTPHFESPRRRRSLKNPYHEAPWGAQSFRRPAWAQSIITSGRRWPQHAWLEASFTTGSKAFPARLAVPKSVEKQEEIVQK